MDTLGIFSIYDQKAKAYLQPFFSLNEDTATRELTKAVNGDGDFNKFSEDYTLFSLGTFDQNKGEFTLNESQLLVCNAATLKQHYVEPVELALAQPGAYEIKENTPNV